SLASGGTGYAVGVVTRASPAERRLAMHYVGLDVHAKRSSLCILDPCGKVVKRMEVRGSWPKLLEQVTSQVPRPFSVCFEASCGGGWWAAARRRRASCGRCFAGPAPATPLRARRCGRGRG